MQFQRDFLGPNLWSTPEFTAVNALLERSRWGIKFLGPEAEKVADGLRQMVQSTGVQRIVLLLTLLDQLAHSSRQVLLSGIGYEPKVSKIDADRINIAHRYVHDHLADEISLPAVAKLVGMKAEPFCRFYRHKTGGKFSTYVNQVRVAHALRLILEDQMSISEACFASGFNDLSNFNRRFRAIKGMNPTEFLRRFQAEFASAPDTQLKE